MRRCAHSRAADRSRCGAFQHPEAAAAGNEQSARLGAGHFCGLRSARNPPERGSDEDFAKSKLCRRVFELADEVRGKPVPRALVPNIRLKSAKITRDLTTEWFAKRVDTRYEQCLRRK